MPINQQDQTIIKADLNEKIESNQLQLEHPNNEDVGVELIEQVMQFKYFGVSKNIISNNHDPTRDLRNQINKATLTSLCFREIVRTIQYMRMDSKIKIYKTCIGSGMTYAIKAREHTNKRSESDSRQKSKGSLEKHGCKRAMGNTKKTGMVQLR